MCELSDKKKKKKNTKCSSSSSSSFGFIIFGLWLPLYFSYFIFSSPYILKLLCFLSPLFFTTTLLLLASILSLSPNPQFGFLLYASQNSSNDDEIDDGIGFLDEFRLYLNVFRAPIFGFLEEFCSDSQASRVGPTEKDDDEEEEIDDKVEIAEETKSEMCGEKGDTEANKGEKVEEISGSKVESGHHHDNNSTKIDGKEIIDDEEFFGTPERNWEWEWEVKKPNIPVCSNSMVVVKRENEWRGTLACKLYEERHSESEAMDLLWETYHDDDDDDDTETNSTTIEFQQKGNIANVDDDDDEEKKGSMDGKYCCLQALKFSAIKMNLGMRKRSIVRISKVLKGIGLLNQLSKHGRKRRQH